jgi:hypothetical protein
VNGGVEIARHREIDQEQRASLASRQRLLDLLARENPTGSARRGQHDIRASELVLDSVKRQSLAAKTLCELFGPLSGPVGDRRNRRPARNKVPDGRLAHLSRSDNENGASLEISEDLLGERRGVTTPAPGSRLRSGSAPLSGLKRLAEGVEQRPRRAGLVRDARPSGNLPSPGIIESRRRPARDGAPPFVAGR